MKNIFQLIIAVVKKLFEVVRKRKIIAEFNSYLPEMVDRYVFTKLRFTIFACSESAPPAVEADNS